MGSGNSRTFFQKGTLAREEQLFRNDAAWINSFRDPQPDCSFTALRALDLLVNQFADGHFCSGSCYVNASTHLAGFSAVGVLEEATTATISYVTAATSFSAQYLPLCPGSRGFLQRAAFRNSQCVHSRFSQNLRPSADVALLKRMGEVIRHRGPDAGGEYLDDHIGLAHRRLSIIDLSPQGNQPLFSAMAVWRSFSMEKFTTSRFCVSNFNVKA